MPDERLVRRLAAVLAAGALLGLLWVGLLGRLAMRLIAARNPDAAGLTSDDGFVIGQVTFGGSLNFAVFGLLVGALGGAVYLALRDLRVGPSRFRLLSISLAPAVVVLAMVVHRDGVDFTVLEPMSLSLLLFLAVIWGFTTSLALLAERWLSPEGPWGSAPRWKLALALAPGILIAPVLGVLAVGRAVLQRLRPLPTALPWLARAGLLVIFLLSVRDLVGDVAALT